MFCSNLFFLATHEHTTITYLHDLSHTHTHHVNGSYKWRTVVRTYEVMCLVMLRVCVSVCAARTATATSGPEDSTRTGALATTTPYTYVWLPAMPLHECYGIHMYAAWVEVDDAGCGHAPSEQGER